MEEVYNYLIKCLIMNTSKVLLHLNHFSLTFSEDPYYFVGMLIVGLEQS